MAGTDDEQPFTPADRERLQLAVLERWFAKRAIDRGHDLYYAKLRAIREVEMNQEGGLNDSTR